MKRLFYIVLILAALLAMGSYGAIVMHTSLSTPKVPWQSLGTLTVECASSPKVSQRTYAVLWNFADANTITWDVPEDVTAAEFRFSTKADADADVVEVWVAANDYTFRGVGDSFMLGAVLTLTGGKQPGPYSNYFVDTISKVERVLTGGEICDSGNDRVAVWRVDLRGYKKVVILATTLQGSTTLYCEVRWF